LDGAARQTRERPTPPCRDRSLPRGHPARVGGGLGNKIAEHRTENESKSKIIPQRGDLRKSTPVFL